MKEIMRGVEAVLAGYTVFPVTASGAGMTPSAHTEGEEARITLLSDKELVILQMLSKGMSNKLIGDALFISDKTVSTYKSRIQEKLGLSSLAALIEFASLHRLID
jgi:two-component system response regulator EvgA